MNVNPKLALLIGIIAVSTASIFVRLSASSPLVIAAYRMLFASILMGSLGINSLKNLKTLSLKEVLILLISGIALGAHFGAWTTSLFYTSIAASTVLTDSSPIFVVMISWILLREQTKIRELLGIIISLIGAIIITSGPATAKGMNDSLYGDLLALSSAFFLSIYLVAGRKIRKNLDLASYTFTVYGIASIVLFIIALFLKNNIIVVSVHEILIFVALALIPSGLGHNSYNYALRYLKASIVSVSILGEPVGASILAVLIFNEIPSPTTIVGGAIVMLGIIITTMYKSS